MNYPSQNTLNARKGITTVMFHVLASYAQRQNTLNARKGITTHFVPHDIASYAM